MQKEIDSAVQFLCGLLRARSLSLNLIEAFGTVLCEIMCKRYNGHWFPEKPCKGSAYRCMRIHDKNIDPLILEAGSKAGLSSTQILQLLPNQLTVWVDPREVAYRIGEDGSIGVLYDASEETKTDIEDDSSSSGIESGSSSVKSSPSQSPVPSSTDEDISDVASSISSTLCRLELGQKASSACRNEHYLNSAAMLVASS